MAGTRWVNFHPGYVNRLRKHYSHLLGSSFLTGKASQTLSGCLPTENADHCMLLNEWTWLRSWVCLLNLKVHLGSVLESETEMKISSVTGMCMLEVASSEFYMVCLLRFRLLRFRLLPFCLLQFRLLMFRLLSFFSASIFVDPLCIACWWYEDQWNCLFLVYRVPDKWFLNAVHADDFIDVDIL